MGEEAVTIFRQAMNLPRDERYQLARELLDSLDDVDDLLPDDPAFYEELARRSDEAHAHPESLLDGEQVMANLHEYLRRKREAYADEPHAPIPSKPFNHGERRERREEDM